VHCTGMLVVNYMLTTIVVTFQSCTSFVQLLCELLLKVFFH